MSTVHYRPDYAKFLVQCPDELWSHYYQALNIASHERKYAGEWLKSHKVNRLHYFPESGMSLWSVDIWGEWTGIVGSLPKEWLGYLKRFDVRSVVWDVTEETVIAVGQHIQRTLTSHNVNVYSTRPASKRLGRDRGGKGFAIGSHKSDLRIACYKRKGEPVAQEFQCSGAMLRRLVKKTLDRAGDVWQVYSIWVALKREIQLAGERRLARALLSAGITQFWHDLGPEDLPQLPPIQVSFGPTPVDDDQLRRLG
ncbi:MAG: hypothetical protein WAW96_13945, partial [Alphaproteobacteria bacterium]